MFASIRLEWYLARLGAVPLSLFCTSTFSSAPVSLMANISSLAERPWRFFILYWECTSVTFRLSFSNMIRSNSSTRSISSNTFVQKSSSSNRKFFRRLRAFSCFWLYWNSLETSSVLPVPSKFKMGTADISCTSSKIISVFSGSILKPASITNISIILLISNASRKSPSSSHSHPY